MPKFRPNNNTLTNRKVSPPKEELASLKPLLMEGEKKLFELFDKILPIEWEIYIRPHLNGVRPDFVLLHPKKGIAVFEVKDWNLSKWSIKIEKSEEGATIVFGHDGRRKFPLRNPFQQIHDYKQEIYELYCPRLQKKSGFGVISAGLVFANSSRQQIDKNFSSLMSESKSYPGIYPVTSKSDLESKLISKIFPKWQCNDNDLMSEELAQDLRNWLEEPEFSAEQRRHLEREMDSIQKNLVLGDFTPGKRRVRGPAGSGKSLVLAARAAELAAQGKSILFITYNITLINYLKDLAVRWGGRNARSWITWLNFHNWCKRVARETEVENQYNRFWKDLFSDHEEGCGESGDASKDSILNKSIPALIKGALNGPRSSQTPHYDAIFVDEAQDMYPEFWNVLGEATSPKSEMWLAADRTQDIYLTAGSWTDESMNDCGFKGPWNELKLSYRLPPTLASHACNFANNFLPQADIALPISPQMELDLFPCKLRWVQVSHNDSINTCVDEILNLPTEADPNVMSIPDTTFITGAKRVGEAVCDKLKEKNIKTIHTFGASGQEDRRRKLAFYKGDARIKATTLHSFKGWETRALVMHIGDKSRQTSSPAVIYTGMTRLKRHPQGSFLTVVCSNPKFEDYGKTWPNFVRV